MLPASLQAPQQPMQSPVVSTPIHPPFLLFLGDEQDPLFAKTATGLLHWRPADCVGVWRLGPGPTLGHPERTPEQAAAAGAATLILGVVSSGGVLPESWTEPLHRALAAGLDIASGLHVPLTSVSDLAAAARQHGRTLRDVRTPPADLPVGTGARRPGRRVLTVGTDCAVGKMFTALAVTAELHRRSVPATFRATGQTGIFIAGDGIPIDAVVSDFVSGAAEILTPSPPGDLVAEHWDVVEGQGSLFHPSFAGVSLGLLHGAQPEALILCHAPTRGAMAGLDRPLPALGPCVRQHEEAARIVHPDARVVGVAVHGGGLSSTEVDVHCARIEEELGIPAVDPLGQGVSRLVDVLLRVSE